MQEDARVLRFFNNQALSLFHKAEFAGCLRRLWARLTGRPFLLDDLDACIRRSEIAGQHHAGLKSVPISRIRGTQGKAGEFDADFHPMQERSRARWVNIALHRLRGHDLPPVELIQVNDTYYVRDGHHRISVSRSLGQTYVDAQVTMMYLKSRVS
ncbi:MAG: hypothetical protein ACOYYS_17430 [Chloroflexota bacterium]